MSEKRIRVWVQAFKDRPTLVLQWFDPVTGKRKSESAGTADPKEAEAKRTDKEADLNAGRAALGPRMSWATFREVFEREHVAARRENTRANYSAMFELFGRLCGPRSLQAVNERTVSAFAAALRTLPGWHGDKGQTPSTVRQRLALLQTALRWAADQGLIPKCPKFPKVKVPRKRPQPVPPETFERLLAKCPDDNLRTYLLCGWLAGLRLAEAVALEWEPTDAAPYLDLARDRIVLPAETVKAVEDQWVPLDPELRRALLALPRQGRKVFRFVTKAGRPVGLSAVSERIIRLARKAGVKLTMRSLRRGFGCHYSGKVPAQVLQRLMRHSSIAVTVGFYANVDDAAMNAVLGPRCNISRNTDAQPAGHRPVATASSQDPVATTDSPQGMGGTSGSGLLNLK
jgi:integrase